MHRRLRTSWAQERFVHSFVNKSVHIVFYSFYSLFFIFVAYDFLFLFNNVACNAGEHYDYSGAKSSPQR